MDQIESKIESSWKKHLNPAFNSASFLQLMKFLDNERNECVIYPNEDHIFKAFNLTPVNQLRVVIIGQDPYHGAGQAHGLAFSVQDEVKIPPSLRNIFKELNNDLGIEIPENGNLEKWARQGVLLLNSCLTVRAGQPASHQNRGWEEFTDSVIRWISNHKQHIVFILWGNFAKQKRELIETNNHFIIQSPHPSPFSANKGFFGSKPFSITNNYLRKNGIQDIDWRLE